MKSEQKAKRLGRLLRDANLAWRERTYDQMAARGYPEIRPAHSPIFRYLPPEGALTVELAVQAGITKQSMGYLVKALAEAGYLELVQDPADGRAQIVRFTDKGTKAERALASISAALEEEFAQSLDGNELGALKTALTLLARGKV